MPNIWPVGTHLAALPKGTIYPPDAWAEMNRRWCRYCDRMHITSWVEDTYLGLLVYPTLPALAEARLQTLKGLKTCLYTTNPCAGGVAPLVLTMTKVCLYDIADPRTESKRTQTTGLGEETDRLLAEAWNSFGGVDGIAPPQGLPPRAVRLIENFFWDPNNTTSSLDISRHTVNKYWAEIYAQCGLVQGSRQTPDGGRTAEKHRLVFTRRLVSWLLYRDDTVLGRGADDISP